MHSQPEQVRTRVKTRVGTRAQCNVSGRCSHTNDHWRALRGFDGLCYIQFYECLHRYKHTCKREELPDLRVSTNQEPPEEVVTWSSQWAGPEPAVWSLHCEQGLK